MSANPGNKLSAWRPSPPDRGSFPLDHYGDCTTEMEKYLNCLKIVRNQNAPNCRLLAKDYLKCRMNHELMDKTENWAELGLPEDQTTTKTTTTKKN